eukprot:1193097-Pyramimonas_sp.AAC.1
MVHAAWGSRYAVPCQTLPCNAAKRCAMLCRMTPWYYIHRYAVYCNAMQCHGVPCDTQCCCLRAIHRYVDTCKAM